MTTPRIGAAARTIVLSSRPLSWINTAYPFAVAYLLSTGRIDAFWLIGTVFFLVPYNLLMYGINDVYDYESDLRNPRKGGAEGALLDPSLHRPTIVAGVLSSTPLLIAMLWLVPTPAAWVTLAVSVFAVVAYSLPPMRTKERPVLDSITSSTHFVSPGVYGAIAAGAEWNLPLVAIMLAFFAWGMAAHAFGAVQDVLPDREANISSIATRFGAAATTRFAIALWSFAALALVAAAASLSQAAPFSAGLLALASPLPLLYVAAVWQFRSVSDRDSPAANRAWKRFLVLNFITGAAVSMLLIAWAMSGAAAF